MLLRMDLSSILQLMRAVTLLLYVSLPFLMNLSLTLQIYATLLRLLLSRPRSRKKSTALSKSFS
jgi:hypothetical protein